VPRDGAKRDPGGRELGLPPALTAQLAGLAEFYLDDAEWSLDKLEYVGDLGAGCYGNVMLMRQKHSAEPVALKLMKRQAVVKARQCAHVMSEKALLLELRHPFIVRLHATFKDEHRLMMAMQFVAGGELYSLLFEKGIFSEAEAQFVAGSVALMIEHIHLRGYVYRDLKPENILLGGDGFPVLVDFGFCKWLPPNERTHTACGTVEYMAPEIVTLQGHGKEVDYWAAGVLLFELVHGHTPFTDGGSTDDERLILANIRNAEYAIGLDPALSSALKALIRGLLRRKPSSRLGHSKVRNHGFFADLDWRMLLHKQVESPLAHQLGVHGKFDLRRFDPDPEDAEAGRSLLELQAGPYPATAADGEQLWDASF